jgi:hypothetical protein
MDTNCTAPSLIPTVNGNTVRSFSTHRQLSAAHGSSTTVSRSDIRSIKHLDFSAHGLVRRWLFLLAISSSAYYPHPPTQLTQPRNYTVVHHYRYTHVHHFRYEHGDDSTPLAPRRWVNPNGTALSLITRSFNGNTFRNFPTHGQLSAAQGNLTSCLNFDFAILNLFEPSAP